MKSNIINILEDIEKTYNISILYATESGSRAWGFASKDSDFDIRFIYKHKLPYYLKAILNEKDTIEMNIGLNGELLDFAGWELKKSLGLLYKGNSQLVEWFQSPYLYKSDTQATLEYKKLIEAFWSENRAIYHYIHMAEKNYRQYIKNPEDKVKRKKYLYVIRPLLACNWIEVNKTMAPMEIDKTLKLIDNESIYPIIVNLLKEKRDGQELALSAKILELDNWVENKLQYYKDLVKNKAIDNKSRDLTLLNDFLYKQIIG